MSWTTLDTHIVIVAALAALACALPGALLVLRGSAMLGDAISHAVLPGLALAFIMTESRDSVSMFIGAAVIGMLTALLTQAIHRWGRVEHNAAMGVVFTTLFAVGLVLIVRGAAAVDLDPGCVLFGNVGATAIDTVSVFGLTIPRAAMSIGSFAIINTAFIVLLYKELTLTSFDPHMADTVGIKSDIVHYLLMALIAATTVAAFEAVGSIIVVAMLIVPGATALLLSQRLTLVLLLAAVMAIMSAIGGHLLAIGAPGAIVKVINAAGGSIDTSIAWETTTAGAMATMAGLLFTTALLAAPQRGLIAQRVRHTRLQDRIAREDLLGLLYRLHESGSTPNRAELQAVAADLLPLEPASIHRAIRGLLRRGLAEDVGQIRLTPAGMTHAAMLVRSHRLWEGYLHRHMQLPTDHLHPTAMDLEHHTSPGLRQALAADADQAATDAHVDPHGQPIPSEPQDQ